VRIVASAIVAVLLRGSAAFAGTVPAGSVVRVDRAIDLAAFTRTIATRYHVVLQRVAAADIDRDGDLDVVAATDRGFLVWVNDGGGRLTSQTPRPKTGLDGRSPGETWSGGRSRHAETIQNDAPSTRLASAYAHAPPAYASTALPSLASDCHLPVCASAHVPRAPPAARP
jgi:FG-GAP-like repeat